MNSNANYPVVCPYCGHKMAIKDGYDCWWFEAGEWDNAQEEDCFYCPECERYFHVKINYTMVIDSISYVETDTWEGFND